MACHVMITDVHSTNKIHNNYNTHERTYTHSLFLSLALRLRLSLPFCPSLLMCVSACRFVSLSTLTRKLCLDFSLQAHLHVHHDRYLLGATLLRLILVLPHTLGMRCRQCITARVVSIRKVSQRNFLFLRVGRGAGF